MDLEKKKKVYMTWIIIHIVLLTFFSILLFILFFLIFFSPYVIICCLGISGVLILLYITMFIFFKLYTDIKDMIYNNEVINQKLNKAKKLEKLNRYEDAKKIYIEYNKKEDIARMNKLIYDQKYKLARNLEKAERLDESLKIYDEIKCWSDAGRIRNRIRDMKLEERANVTKYIHIQANDLFQQIRKNGLVIPYKCPNCHGTLKITGKRIDSCPYCGSDLDLETLSSLIRSLI